jgi:hypothetical protein
MSLKKDKIKVLGEVFDDARIKTFLDLQPYGDTDADFHVLEKAYRGMNIDNFITFISFFLEQNRNINATNSDGKNLLQLVSSHRHGSEYATALQQAGSH